jgi:hypothetical protein
MIYILQTTFLPLFTTLTTLTTLIHGTQAVPALGHLKSRGFNNHNPLDYYMKWDDASGTYQPNMGGMNDLMVGDMDDTGNRRRRSNCIFYVNQRPPMNDTDPNWAKKRALQFADLMNLAQAGGDYVSCPHLTSPTDVLSCVIIQHTLCTCVQTE